MRTDRTRRSAISAFVSPSATRRGNFHLPAAEGGLFFARRPLRGDGRRTPRAAERPAGLVGVPGGPQRFEGGQRLPERCRQGPGVEPGDGGLEGKVQPLEYGRPTSSRWSLAASGSPRACSIRP